MARSLVVVVAGVLTVAACTGGGDEAADTTTPSTSPSTSATETVAPDTEPAADTIVDTADELDTLPDVVADEFAPATRTDELALAFEDGEPLTVQQAVDVFDLVYGPFPGATPSDLPPGAGFGTAFTLAAIESVRHRLAPDQLAALDAIDAAVSDTVTITVDDTAATATAGGPADPTTSTASTSTVATAPTTEPTETPEPTGGSEPQGLRRPGVTVGERYGNLAAQAMTDWLAYRPDLPLPTIVVQIMTVQPVVADMDAFPYQPDPSICRIRVFPQVVNANQDDASIRSAFAHELFHCVQYQWQNTGKKGLIGSDWLIEGSASWAMLDLYRNVGDTPQRYTPVTWFDSTTVPLAIRTYSAWPLFETARQTNRDTYELIRTMVRSKQAVTADLLEVGGLDQLLFRMRWASSSVRATQFPEQDWQLEWPNSFRSGGPLDNTIPKGARGVGQWNMVGATKYAHPTLEVTMHPKVGLVVVTPNGAPVSTHTAEGTVVVAEGSAATFCFSPDGCACPGEQSSGAYQMNGREMVFSFAANATAPRARVQAVEWNPDKHCKDVPPTRRGSSNGDPHMVSFDGMPFDVHAPGEFVLVRDPVGGVEVQVRHEPLPLFGAGTSAVAVGTGDHRMTFTAESLDSPDPPVVRVDGDEIDLGDSTEVGDLTVLADPDGMRFDVAWPDGTVLHLRWFFGFQVWIDLLTERAERAEGLLTAANGMVIDDLPLPDGTFLSPEEQDRIDTDYVEPWYLDDRTTLFDYEAGESPQTFRDVERPQLPPDPDDEALAECDEGLGDESTSYELLACAFDLASTGEAGYVELYTEVVDERVSSTPNPVEQPSVVVVDDEPTATLPPASVPPPEGAALVLEGTLWDGYSLIDDPDAVPGVVGALELEEGAVVLARAERCMPDVDVVLEVYERDSDRGGARLNVCDLYELNGALAPSDAEVIDGETYAWITTGGTYDFALTASSPTPVFVSVALFTDTAPTIVDAAAARSEGTEITLDGTADTLVFLLDTDDESLSWTVSGLDQACGAEVYGPALGGGGAWTLSYCDHSTGISMSPTGDIVVPVIAFTRTDEPVQVEIRPSG